MSPPSSRRVYLKWSLSVPFGRLMKFLVAPTIMDFLERKWSKATNVTFISVNEVSAWSFATTVTLVSTTRLLLMEATLVLENWCSARYPFTLNLGFTVKQVDFFKQAQLNRLRYTCLESLITSALLLIFICWKVFVAYFKFNWLLEYN